MGNSTRLAGLTMGGLLAISAILRILYLAIIWRFDGFNPFIGQLKHYTIGLLSLIFLFGLLSYASSLGFKFLKEAFRARPGK